MVVRVKAHKHGYTAPSHPNVFLLGLNINQELLLTLQEGVMFETTLKSSEFRKPHGKGPPLFYQVSQKGSRWVLVLAPSLEAAKQQKDENGTEKASAENQKNVELRGESQLRLKLSRVSLHVLMPF